MWSLGCILFELHSGDPLFGSAKEEELPGNMAKVLGLPPRRKKKEILLFDDDGVFVLQICNQISNICVPFQQPTRGVR